MFGFGAKKKEPDKPRPLIDYCPKCGCGFNGHGFADLCPPREYLPEKNCVKRTCVHCWFSWLEPAKEPDPPQEPTEKPQGEPLLFRCDDCKVGFSVHNVEGGHGPPTCPKCRSRSIYRDRPAPGQPTPPLNEPAPDRDAVSELRMWIGREMRRIMAAIDKDAGDTNANISLGGEHKAAMAFRDKMEELGLGSLDPPTGSTVTPPRPVWVALTNTFESWIEDLLEQEEKVEGYALNADNIEVCKRANEKTIYGIRHEATGLRRAIEEIQRRFDE